ncbi:MAG: hypothetical protein J6C67_05810 [Muribaculaceae bacterium]|nr:hypothetical protein [Muribaculaceae bacterium]
MNDSSSRHAFILLATALSVLLVLSMLPWSGMTGNMIKNFSFFSDLFPSDNNPGLQLTASEDLDPELVELMNNSPATPAVAGDSTATDTMTAPAAMAQTASIATPMIDGHVAIECYTGGEPLANFRDALTHGGSRVVRVAVIGDSFIEGDIFTQDLRSLLQQEYGGQGVGYMPLYSAFPGFRRSVSQSCDGWNQVLAIRQHDSDSLRTLAGEYNTAGADARTTYTGTRRFETARRWTNSRLLYINRAVSDSSATVPAITIDGDISAQGTSTAAGTVECLALEGETAHLSVTLPAGAVALGAYLDGDSGIALDCMSVRGNSGLTLRRLNPNLCRAIAQWIDYDLIILEFGINALSAEQTDYAPYAAGMARSIERVRQCYPNADIIVMGIADRGIKQGSQVTSMPTCQAMVNAQRHMAVTSGVHFYDLRTAQGGDGAVVDWRRRGLVNADYIHINHQGGKELAAEFLIALRNALQQRTADTSSNQP